MNHPKRPTNRAFGEAVVILKNEVAQMLAWSARNASSEYEILVKLSGQRERKAHRIAKVIAWMETLRGAPPA
jgi:hypothetical protein